MGRINTGGAKKRTGDNIATGSSVSGTTLKLTPPKGYYDGLTGTVNITDADFLDSNIANGVNLFGKNGTKVPKVQTGTNSSAGSTTTFKDYNGSNQVASYLEISGLTFQPTKIMIRKASNNGDFTVFNNGFICAPNSNADSKIIYHKYNAGTPTVTWIKLDGTAYVTSSGFKLPVQDNNTSYYWEAYE